MRCKRGGCRAGGGVGWGMRSPLPRGERGAGGTPASPRFSPHRQAAGSATLALWGRRVTDSCGLGEKEEFTLPRGCCWW